MEMISTLSFENLFEDSVRDPRTLTFAIPSFLMMKPSKPESFLLRFTLKTMDKLPSTLLSFLELERDKRTLSLNL